MTEENTNVKVVNSTLTGSKLILSVASVIIGVVGGTFATALTLGTERGSALEKINYQQSQITSMQSDLSASFSRLQEEIQDIRGDFSDFRRVTEKQIGVLQALFENLEQQLKDYYDHIIDRDHTTMIAPQIDNDFF